MSNKIDFNDLDYIYEKSGIIIKFLVPLIFTYNMQWVIDFYILLKKLIKNVSKKLSGRYSQKLADSAKKL